MLLSIFSSVMKNRFALLDGFLVIFLVETNTTFNTNRLNMPLSVLLGITNTGSSFPAAYCFISSESKESSLFMFACMEELMFYDQCVGPNVILGDCAAGLGAAMVKAVNPREMPGGETKSAWEISQAMDPSRTDCTLHYNYVVGMQQKQSKKAYQSWKLSA